MGEKIKSKFEIYQQDSKNLTDHGWKQFVFYYQIGNFEDENDDCVFVKNDVLLWFDYTWGRWFEGVYSRCRYESGIDISKGVVDIQNFL